jgi:hypothetical protein
MRMLVCAEAMPKDKAKPPAKANHFNDDFKRMQHSCFLMDINIQFSIVVTADFSTKARINFSSTAWRAGAASMTCSLPITAWRKQAT